MQLSSNKPEGRVSGWGRVILSVKKVFKYTNGTPPPPAPILGGAPNVGSTRWNAP